MSAPSYAALTRFEERLRDRAIVQTLALMDTRQSIEYIEQAKLLVSESEEAA